MLTALALLVSLAAEERVYKIGEDGVRAPRLVYRVEPEYSNAAREAQIDGVVLLSLEVTDQGKPEKVAIVKGLEEALDRNAVAAVSQWKFAPATKRDGTAVRVKATIEVQFRHL